MLFFFSFLFYASSPPPPFFLGGVGWGGGTSSFMQTRHVGLDLFNAESSPERCWRGARSQEVGGGRGEVHLTLHCHHQSSGSV